MACSNSESIQHPMADFISTRYPTGGNLMNQHFLPYNLLYRDLPSANNFWRADFNFLADEICIKLRSRQPHSLD